MERLWRKLDLLIGLQIYLLEEDYLSLSFLDLPVVFFLFYVDYFEAFFLDAGRIVVDSDFLLALIGEVCADIPNPAFFIEVVVANPIL